MGTINQSYVYPREILKEALFNDASSVIFAHNHPGGSLEPSKDDIKMTERLVETLSTVDIKVIDHICLC